VHGVSKGVGVDYRDILYQETPVEKHGGLYFKRDDLFEFAGMRGAKVRAALLLCLKAKEAGFSSVVSACSRHSPQLAILGSVGRELGLGVVGFVAEGSDTPIMRRAIQLGVAVCKVKAGYSVVVRSRAREYAEATGAFLVPFGMAGPDAVALTECQAESVFSVEAPYRRVVLVAGSGVNMAGVVRGMVRSRADIPVVGVLVGHDCSSFVSGYCKDFRGQVSLVRSVLQYNDDALYSSVNGVEVDSRYEGKAVSFLLPGDLFWLIGFVGSSLVPVNRTV
jgi:1-aminocyclopropane-1-carboxylate deaminase/D-cysteine desulfhydrase-like pyridoxal-dependent ACC family enzyme